MSITVRKLQFALPEAIDPVFIRGEPEESYVNVALSLLLPYLEPYLIRSMRAAKPHVKDASLAADLEGFCAQEGHHYRQHTELNASFRRHSGAILGAADALERELAEDYKRFAKSRSLRFNLAYAEGFEALTSAMGFIFVEEDQSKWEASALDLFTWHLVEELEHRTVAFEIYDHVVGSWPYRIAVGAYAQWHLLRFLLRASEAMLAADPRTEAEFGGKAGRKSREPRLVRILTKKLLPRVLRTYRPSYTPRTLDLPEAVVNLAADYTKRATTATA